MPVTDDPQVGCKYTWSTRRDSMVEMVNKLFLPKAEIELTISIHRMLLFTFLRPVDENPQAHIRAGVALTKLFGGVPKAHDLVSPEERRFSGASTAPRRRKRLSFSNKGLLRLQRLNALFFSPWRLAEEIAIALENLASKSARRGRKVSGHILETHDRGARLSMAYDSWLVLKAFFDSPSPGQDRIENLSTQIHLLFLFSSTLDRIVRPEPRGTRAGKQSLGQYLPQAYFACRELLRRSEACAELDELIEKLISSFAEKDPEVQPYWTAAQKQTDSYRDQMAAVCLVYRAFYGAWELYNIQGRVDPQEAFRRYLYGKRAHQLGHAAKALNSTVGKDLLMDNWIRLYLDAQPGSAARAYRLISAPPLRRSAQIH